MGPTRYVTEYWVIGHCRKPSFNGLTSGCFREVPVLLVNERTESRCAGLASFEKRPTSLGCPESPYLSPSRARVQGIRACYSNSAFWVRIVHPVTRINRLPAVDILTEHRKDFCKLDRSPFDLDIARGKSDGWVAEANHDLLPDNRVDGDPNVWIRSISMP